LSQIGTNDHRHLVLGQDTANETLNHFAETIKTNTDVMHILLMDDLGIAFSSGNNALITGLNQLGDQLNIMSHDNFMVVIADLYSNLKSPQTYNSSFLKLFQQSQAGVFYSMDESDMQWFNAPISLQQKKSLKWLPGRGFYVAKGKAEFIQSPLITPPSIDLSHKRKMPWAKVVCTVIFNNDQKRDLVLPDNVPTHQLANVIALALKLPRDRDTYYELKVPDGKTFQRLPDSKTLQQSYILNGSRLYLSQEKEDPNSRAFLEGANGFKMRLRGKHADRPFDPESFCGYRPDPFGPGKGRVQAPCRHHPCFLSLRDQGPGQP